MSLFPGVAFITGAGSGIGRQTAISFAFEGCDRIAITDTSSNGLGITKFAIEQAGLETKVLALTVDVRDEKAVIDAVAKAVEEFGRIDYAVNCAGIYGPNLASPEVSAEDFDNVFAVNARGLWLCMREQTRQMKTQEPLPTHDDRPGARGSVVNVASSLGVRPIANKAPYASSKAAVIQMTKADALHCAPLQIRVNCVIPGIVDTPFTKDIPDDGPAVNAMPVTRKGSPQEIADVILFLSSPKASFMQGSCVVADGGHTI